MAATIPKLSNREFQQRVAEPRGPETYLDLTGFDVSEIDLAKEQVLVRIMFGSRKRRPADIGGLDLGNKTFIDCSFCGVEFRGTNLRGATLTDCDFRYARLLSATLQDAQIKACDFYRAYFGDGTILVPEVLETSSFTRAYLAGIIDLRKRHVQRIRGAPPALAQEQEPQEYAEFLERTADDRFERNAGERLSADRRRSRSDSLETTINDRYDEAAVVYRRLAALWTSQGAYRYAGWAYVQGKRNERRHASPFRRLYSAKLLETGRIEVARLKVSVGDRAKAFVGKGKEPEQSLFRWGVLLLADWLSAFGEGLAHVFGSLAVVVLAFGLALAATDGVLVEKTHAAGLGDSLLFSLTGLVDATPARLTAATEAVRVATASETILGIILLALFGFVLGNKLHSA